MKNNLKKTILLCMTAGFICMSAQTVETAENQEIAMGSCKESMQTQGQKCKEKKGSCSQKKGQKPPRKSAARKVIEGS